MSVSLSSLTNSQMDSQLDVIVPKLFKKLNGIKYTVATKTIQEIEEVKKQSLQLNEGSPVVIKIGGDSFIIPQNSDELRNVVEKIKERALLLHKKGNAKVKRKITGEIKALDIILAQLTPSPLREEKQNSRKRTSDQQTSVEECVQTPAKDIIEKTTKDIPKVTAKTVESLAPEEEKSGDVKKQELLPQSPLHKRQKVEQKDVDVPLVDVDVPLVGDKIGIPFEVIRRQSPSIKPTEKEKKTEESLESLGKDFDACQIRGDGHCLFRSFAMSLLKSYMPNNLAELKNKLDDLLIALTNEERASSKNEINNMYLCLDTLKNLSIEEVMQNQNISDGFVKCLRLFAAHQIEKEKIEVGDKVFSDSERKAYCQDLKNMQKANYGGVSELFALSGLFGKTIGVIDLDAMVGGDGVTIKGYHISTEKNKPLKQKGIEGSESDTFRSTDIFILKQGDHYNSLFRKIGRKREPEKNIETELPQKRTKTDEGFFLNIVQVLNTSGFLSILKGLKEKNKFAQELKVVLKKGSVNLPDKSLIHILESLKENGVNLEESRQCDMVQVLDKIIKLSCGVPLLESVKKVSLVPFYSKLKDIFNVLKFDVKPETFISVPSLNESPSIFENVHTIHIPQKVEQWNLKEAFDPVKIERQVDFLVDKEKAPCTKAYVQMFLKHVPYEEQLCINSPQTLFIKLDRFVPGSNWLLGYGAYKRDCTVQSPYFLQLRGKEDSLATYKLKSVVVHEGGVTPDSGQYSTYIPVEESLNQEGIPLNWKNGEGERVTKEKIEKSGYLFSYELT